MVAARKLGNSSPLARLEAIGTSYNVSAPPSGKGITVSLFTLAQSNPAIIEGRRGY